MIRIRVRVFIKRASRVDGVELVDIAILRRLAGKTSFKFDIYCCGRYLGPGQPKRLRP